MYTINTGSKIIEEAGITNYKHVSLITEHVLMPFASQRTQGIMIKLKVIHSLQHFPIDLLFFKSGSFLGLRQKV